MPTNKSNTSNLNSLGETNPVTDLRKSEENFPKIKTENIFPRRETEKMIGNTLQPERLREMRVKNFEPQRVSSLKKRRRYIESKDYKGDSKIPDSINEEIIKFLEESPYGTGLPKNIEELLKAQLDYQYKHLVHLMFFCGGKKTIGCYFNFYGPFEGINYWAGKAIYNPTKKQFELYDIYHTNRANEDGIG